MAEISHGALFMKAQRQRRMDERVTQNAQLVRSAFERLDDLEVGGGVAQAPPLCVARVVTKGLPR